MNKQVEKTKLFHRKQNFVLNEDLKTYKDNSAVSDLLKQVRDTLINISTELELVMKTESDVRIARSQIMIEELGETILGLANCDEIETLDGLADLNFVTIGTAITFDLPIIEGLDEVCNSNLTKDPRKKDDIRLRDKGPNYRPPNLKQVSSIHRGIWVNAIRIDCRTDTKIETKVRIQHRYPRDAGEAFIYVTSGGVTGFESMRVSHVLTRNRDEWIANKKTPFIFDGLIIPAESMFEIRKWLKGNQE